MIIKKVHVDKFRKIQNIDFNLGEKITIIAGQNGTMKTTLLGLIGQPFSMKDTSNPMHQEKTIDSSSFMAPFSDKFKFSLDKEKPGDHKWSLQLDPGVYPKEIYEAISIPRKEKGRTDDIRIWSSEGREKAMGYVQCPVIFLSLKRLTPIGEEKKIDRVDPEFSADEASFFRTQHNEILLLEENIEAIEQVKSSNKSTLGARTSDYDSLTNSAGQDNVGKILMAVLSFRRLKEKYPDHYKGGILLIDELDATMFPRAQEKLFERLVKFARDYSLQIIVTTHSTSIIELATSLKYEQDVALIYLRIRSNLVQVFENPTYQDIEADLRVRVAAKETGERIRVYCEDEVAYSFLNGIIPSTLRRKMKFMRNVTLGCANLINLARQKIPEFCNNVVVLDGDCSNKRLEKNICTLPGDGKCPEKVIYEFVRGLSDTDPFWENDLSGYRRQVCFSTYSGDDLSEEKIKKWYKEQVVYWGRDGYRVIKRWKECNATELRNFQERFAKAYAAATA